MNNVKTRPRNMRVLFVAAEAAPFAKVGGLGEVLRSLPRAMRKLGCDARVFTPKYAGIDTARFPMGKHIKNIRLAAKQADPHGLLVSNILRNAGRETGTTYFLENMEFFEKRANVYGYTDDTMRWVLLSRAVIEFVKRSRWKPDFIIANDWQTGFIPDLLKTEYKDDPELSKIKTIYCIHNLRMQGTFDVLFVSDTDSDSGQGPIPDFFSPDMKKLNGMRRGILFADQIITVSPTYAKEIMNPENGNRLDGILRDRRGDVSGILNGIDTERVNPENDSEVEIKYSYKTVKNRAGNKAVLQRRMGLPEKDVMIIGFNGRLDEQKGLSLIRESLAPLLENLDFQFVLVGNGDKNFKIFLKELQEKYPNRVAAHLEYDDKLPWLIYAGADVVLIPSKYEPSGLVQMEAMRYGCIPIVRKTGGLADTVEDYNPDNATGTGFVFEKFDANALLVTMVRAYESYRNKSSWAKLVERAMKQDFSWKNSAKKYMAVCRRMQMNMISKEGESMAESVVSLEKG